MEAGVDGGTLGSGQWMVFKRQSHKEQPHFLFGLGFLCSKVPIAAKARSSLIPKDRIRPKLRKAKAQPKGRTPKPTPMQDPNSEFPATQLSLNACSRFRIRVLDIRNGEALVSHSGQPEEIRDSGLTSCSLKCWGLLEVKATNWSERYQNHSPVFIPRLRSVEKATCWKVGSPDTRPKIPT